MQKDRLVGRVIRRGVDITGDVTAWRRAFAIFKQVSLRHGAHEALKITDAAEIETSKQDAPKLRQILIHEFAIAPGPFDESDAFHNRLDDQREFFARPKMFSADKPM